MTDGVSGPGVRSLGHVAYAPTLAAMRAFTESRSADTPDELWLAEHHPVFTQGVAGRAEHVHAAGNNGHRCTCFPQLIDQRVLVVWPSV